MGGAWALWCAEADWSQLSLLWRYTGREAERRVVSSSGGSLKLEAAPVAGMASREGRRDRERDGGAGEGLVVACLFVCPTPPFNYSY